MSTKVNPAAKIDEVIRAFHFPGELELKEEFGNGHINSTFILRLAEADGKISEYILQRINHEVFKDPYGVMDNVVLVTRFLRKKLREEGKDPERGTIHYLHTDDGKPCYKDSMGSYWRCYRFIDDAISYESVENPQQFYQSAVAFGHFQQQLSDFPADQLKETIPNFHNTPVRFETFKKAVAEDVCGRAASVQKEIQFFLDREEFAHTLTDLQEKGEIPLRVTHNDTKLNNILFDKTTGDAMCVIDLDTVMPGLSVNDFGDSIRFGASTGAEDEPDLTKVNFDLNLYELYTKGYLEGCQGSLTETERKMLPVGAKMMTLECGMRFLTDYLQGDTYFRIHREGHNLDRCRTHIKLVSDMEAVWEQMEAIAMKY